MDQARAPILEALLRYSDDLSAPFHMPGHKGRWFDREFGEILKGAALLDRTEVPGLDDLYDPSGPIAEALQLASHAFGSWKTLFSVGGATVGLLAVLMSLLREGDVIALDRASHRSAFSALVLSGAVPRYLAPEYDPDLGVPLGANPDGSAGQLDGEVKAILITSPNYFGAGVDVAAWAGAAHERDIPLVLDEAHGSHFAFHPAFPLPGLRCGADAVIHGLHKTTPAFTGTGLIHLAKGRLDPGEVERFLQLVQTSSPSYLLMASIDAARRRLCLSGKDDFDRVLELRQGLKEALADSCWGLWDKSQDPCKAVLFRLDGRGTFDAPKTLAEKGIVPEYADERLILLILTPGDRMGDIAGLVRALEEARPGPVLGPPEAPPAPRCRLSPRKAALARKKTIPVTDAEGEVAADFVIPYPPGVPVLAPGEEITGEVIEYISWPQLKLRGQKGLITVVEGVENP